MATLIQDLLVPGVPLLEKILRPLLVYVFLIVGLRLAGKRELGQMNPFDLVVLLTLSNTVQNAIIGNDNSLLGGLVGAATLLLVNWLAVRFFYRHRRFGRLLIGAPIVLIERGRVRRERLEAERITEEELLTACREHGADRFEQIDRTILETDGAISIHLRHSTREERSDDEVARRLAAIEQLLRVPGRDGPVAADAGGPRAT